MQTKNFTKKLDNFNSPKIILLVEVHTVFSKTYYNSNFITEQFSH